MRGLTLATCVVLTGAVLFALVSATALASAPASDPLYPMVSPDGKHLAWVEGTTWRIWTANLDGTGAHVFGPSFASNGIGGIAWTRDGIVVDANFTFFLLSSVGTRSTVAPAGDQTFSAGGDRLATDGGQSGGPASVVDLRTRKVTRLPAVQPVLSRDGKRLAWATNTGIWVSSSTGASAKQIVAGRASCLSWSSDGRSLAYMVFHTGPSGELHVAPVAGGKSHIVARHVSGCTVSWSPDDRYIAVGRTQLAVVHVATGAVTRSSATVGLVVGGFVWSADSKSIYASARPRAAEAVSNNCTSLWRLAAPSLVGGVIVRGCR